MRLRILLQLSVLAGWLVLSGCNHEFWDPKQVGRFRSVPVQHVILDSLGLAEEGTPEYAGAEPPRPEDVIADPEDYALNPGDIIRISIYELLEESQQYVNDFSISETGRISLPEIGLVHAAGLTERELENEITQVLMPDILKAPSVTVSLQMSEYRAYSVLGTGLLSTNTGGGRFLLPRHDFRLAQALATAGGIGEYNVSYVYVVRQLNQREIFERLGEGDRTGYIELPAGSRIHGKDQILPEDEFDARRAEEELLELIAPSDMGKASQNKPLLSMTDIGEQGAKEEPTRIEWIFEGGRWVPIEVDSSGQRVEQKRSRPRDRITEYDPTLPSTPSEPDFRSLEDVMPSDYALADASPLRYMVRVIKIPRQYLYSGDPRFNIIIRAGDTIVVPSDSIGEFAILGNIVRPGYYNLSGRPMTLMQAIAAAGGLGELASPENVEVRRRIGNRHEEIVMVNLKKIAQGLQPDFFIKENDTINVGTDSYATWLYILRNAFGASYGFSFTYNRNYADRDYGTSRPFGGLF